MTEHVLREDCDRLNRVFFHYITTKRPFVSMKYAMTLDGKIAAHTGASRWITGEAARAHVQHQRHRFRGIMVGVGTVLADDPSLECHMEGGRNPVRIICDTHLRTPPEAQVVTTAGSTPTILVQAYIAPKLFGGKDAKTPVEGLGVPSPAAAFHLKDSRICRLGEDFLIESEVAYPCSPES